MSVSPNNSGKVWPLQGNQLPAVDPRESVWLGASAGTGKTQVLSARVLRLLLRPGVAPSQILCLTFTKAGAAEMATRVNEVLASWVRMPDAVLAVDLAAIGAETGRDTIARARTLFASVLDCPGGGLRIDTIHAFAQWLLGAFPHEAGLTPGTRAMEDRDRDLLVREVLGGLLLDAETRGDTALLDALAKLSLRMAPDQVERFLLRCAEARGAWLGTGAWQVPLRSRVNRLLGLEADEDEAHLHARCGDALDCAALRRVLAAYRGWSAKTGAAAAATIEAWLDGDGPLRADSLDALWKELFTQKNEPKNFAAMLKISPDYADDIAAVQWALETIRERRALITLAGWLAPALTLGRQFALAWDAAKTREGLIDFDDQIRRAADLLDTSELGEWIRYKLDRRFDHILIDEAQDTNAAQWRIIHALIGDFYSGAGAGAERMRTLFVVGDYKQAIFRFQGTSPENFEAAKLRVATSMAQAAGNAERLRDGTSAPELQDLGLGTSYRTAQPVLDFVDAAISGIGHERFGLGKPPERHIGEDRPGLVALWQAVGIAAEPDEEADAEAGPDTEEGGEGWLSRPDRMLAENIAQQVAAWMRDGFPLVKGGARRAGPGDVMVLVRKRKELAGLIVARLYAAGVPVAGVDRLRLGAPLGVRDVVAALRFAAQPFDDLNLAALLVSPLLGWTQEQLLEHAFRPTGVTLWSHLRRARHPDVTTALDRLGALLAIADYAPPQALLHWVLVGPWQGRRRLVARLGHEVNDPLDELLNAAQAYASGAVPSLVGFLHWFDAGEGELKREPGRAADQVRVMTVHGAKGLQAPIVILADAADNPDRSPAGSLALLDPGSERSIPLPGLRKEERLGPILAADLEATKAEREEHFRLLYVAMTRAEEALFVTGSLGKREDEPAPDSWYAHLAARFGGAHVEDPVWGRRWEHGALGPVPAVRTEPASIASAVRPSWLDQPIGEEPRPPRPLAPSSLGEDQSPDPPLAGGLAGAALADAARRGVLIHRLLERLPEVAADDREAAARRWLARSAAELAPTAQAEIVAAALAVAANPAWSSLFSGDALAEVPIAAVVGGQVIAGTIDRLLVGPGDVRLVDYKTTRRPPASAEQVPLATLRQMGAYAAALAVTFPGRRISAALLYTHTPHLIELPEALLAAHKPGLAAREEALPG